MRIQKRLMAITMLSSVVSLNTSAAIINHVDFPEQFIQAKAKKMTPVQEPSSAVATEQLKTSKFINNK